MKKTTVNIFNGHIVHCHDLDSGDKFNVEVLINQLVTPEKLIDVAIDAAKCDQVVKLSGNTFEFEYLQPSGRSIRKTVTTVKETLSGPSAEAEELLEKMSID
jgi:hypothetical protein